VGFVSASEEHIVRFLDKNLRSHLYAIALMRYGKLFLSARSYFKPEERSLLTILEKLTQIMLESCCAAAPHIIEECRKAVASAEQALNLHLDVKRQRKLIKIKDSLLLVTQNIANDPF
jgi:hypothetical protein